MIYNINRGGYKAYTFKCGQRQIPSGPKTTKTIQNEVACDIITIEASLYKAIHLFLSPLLHHMTPE